MAANNESAVLFDQPGPKGRKTIRIINWIAGIIFAIVVVLILMRLHNPPDGENQLSWELWKPALDPEGGRTSTCRACGPRSELPCWPWWAQWCSAWCSVSGV